MGIDIKGNSFIAFLKNKKCLCIISCFCALIIYGTRLTNRNFGVDSATFLAGKEDQFLDKGRFGISAIQNFLLLQHPDYIFNTCASVILLIFSALSWVYVISCFQKEEYGIFKGQLSEIIFAVFYLSSPVWAEWIYFPMMSFSIFAGVAICPWCVWLLFLEIQRKTVLSLDGKKAFLNRYYIGTVLLVALELSIYQAVFLLLCSGTAALYLVSRHSRAVEGESLEVPRRSGRECIHIAGIFLGGIALYYVINLVVVRGILHVADSGYIGGTFTPWSKTKLYAVAGYVYKVFFADIPVLNRLVDPVIAANAMFGETSVAEFHNMAWISCILYFPAFLIFLADLFSTRSYHDVWYRIIGICFILLVLLPALVGTGDPQIRVQISLAFSGAFLLLWSWGWGIRNRRAAAVWMVLFVLAGWFQTQKSAALIHSDQVRFEEDLKLADEINDHVLCLDEGQNNPGSGRQMLIIGEYKPQYNAGFVQGELLGKSCFYYGAKSHATEATYMGVNFMKAAGYNFTPVSIDDPELSVLRDMAEEMPCYPAKGFVQEEGNYILVKLSESVWTGAGS